MNPVAVYSHGASNDGQCRRTRAGAGDLPAWPPPLLSEQHLLESHVNDHTSPAAPPHCFLR